MPAESPADEVAFLRRAWPSLRDLWVEFFDWTPTIVTGTAVLLLPYLMFKFLEPGKPHHFAGIERWAEWLWRDRAVRWSIQASATTCVAVWIAKVVAIVAERVRRVVRIDLHEIECWPYGTLRYIPVRDVIGAHAGWRDTSSRWWILRAQRKGLWLFVRSATGSSIERVPFDWSRYEFIGIDVPMAGDDDGNRAAADLIALLRRRRAKLGLPLQELPEEPVRFESETGLVVEGDRDRIVMHLPGRDVTLPGWAIRAAAVTAKRTGKGPSLQLSLDLDPRCGEFHLLAPIGRSDDDRKIVEWCRLLAARFDKDVIEHAARHS